MKQENKVAKREKPHSPLDHPTHHPARVHLASAQWRPKAQSRRRWPGINGVTVGRPLLRSTLELELKSGSGRVVVGLSAGVLPGGVAAGAPGGTVTKTVGVACVSGTIVL